MRLAVSCRRIARQTVLLTGMLGSLGASATARGQTLDNGWVRATFGPRGLTAVELREPTGHRHALARDETAVQWHAGADTVRWETAAFPAPAVTRGNGSLTYRWQTGTGTLDIVYELRPGWRFVGKTVRVAPSVAAYHVDSVTVIRSTLATRPTSLFRPTSARAATLGTRDYGAALRFGPDRALLVVAQNPFLDASLTDRTIALRYAPDMAWQQAWGPYVADRAFLAPVVPAGRVLPARMAPEWTPATQAGPDPGLDEAEVAAFTAMVRAAMVYEPKRPLHVFVGWTANDYQIDVARPEGRAEYLRVFDQAAAVGAQYVLYGPSNSAVSRREESVDDWSWEHVLWLGLGQQIRRGTWNVRQDPLPTSISTMIAEARTRQLGLLAYVYPVLPFAQDSSWLVPAREGSSKRAATLGSRALQDWLIDQLVTFHARTGIAGYAFDYTFLTYPGTSRYAQWHGWRRVMETLRQRIPDVVIDGRQAYHLYGPWSWLAGSYPHPTFHDEQPESFTPYPDLHFDRVSANRERYTAYRYRNYEFTPAELMPGYMTHQTSRSDESNDMPFAKTADRGVVLTPFRVRDWDLLGWRYSVLSSIAVAGWNNVIDYLPARDSAEFAHFSAADQRWLRDWLDWTVTHRELLRHTRTILGQPALGKIDGTAAIDGDHGVLFLFNPDARQLTARIPLDGSIGLLRGRQFLVREKEPLAGRTWGPRHRAYYAMGDTLEFTLDGGSALVLEVMPAPLATSRHASPLVIGAPGTATLDGTTLRITGVRGPVGAPLALRVAVPGRQRVEVVTVNGIRVAIAERTGDLLHMPVRIAGTPFAPMHPVIRWDSTRTGGRVSGTLVIPRRIIEQLRERRARWPMPWTSEDYRTTWLAAERLLLFAPFAQPDDRWETRLFIDGRPVEFRKAYTAVRVVRSTFTGFYADLSLLEPDREHRIEIELPEGLAPGQFLGLYVDNVEAEYGDQILPPAR